MDKERIELLTDIKIRNNERVIAEKMARTFAYRRQEVVNQEPSIKDFKDRWPALFPNNPSTSLGQPLAPHPPLMLVLPMSSLPQLTLSPGSQGQGLAKQRHDPQR